MTSSLQSFFGLTVPASSIPVSSAMARVLAKRIKDANAAMQQSDVPVAQAAELRRDAERYLAVRRTGSLRLPTSLERTCDDDAHMLMRLTASTPPSVNVSERLVA